MTSRMQYCRRRQCNAEARFAILRVAIRGAAGYHNGHSRRSATCRASVWKSCSPSDTQHHDGRRHEQREQLKAATRRKERRNLLYIHCQVWHGVYGSARHDQGKETEGMVSDDPAVTHDISKTARWKRTWGQDYRWVWFFPLRSGRKAHAWRKTSGCFYGLLYFVFMLIRHHVFSRGDVLTAENSRIPLKLPCALSDFFPP